MLFKSSAMFACLLVSGELAASLPTRPKTVYSGNGEHIDGSVVLKREPTVNPVQPIKSTPPSCGGTHSPPPAALPGTPVNGPAQGQPVTHALDFGNLGAAPRPDARTTPNGQPYIAEIHSQSGPTRTGVDRRQASPPQLAQRPNTGVSQAGQPADRGRSTASRPATAAGGGAANQQGSARARSPSAGPSDQHRTPSPAESSSRGSSPRRARRELDIEDLMERWDAFFDGILG